MQAQRAAWLRIALCDSMQNVCMLFWDREKNIAPPKKYEQSYGIDSLCQKSTELFHANSKNYTVSHCAVQFYAECTTFRIHVKNEIQHKKV